MKKNTQFPRENTYKIDINPANLHSVEAVRVFCLSPIPPFKDRKSLRMRVLGFQGAPGASFPRIFTYKMSMGTQIHVKTRRSDVPIAWAPDTRENTMFL